MARADAAMVTTLGWIVTGAGLLAYISSFLPWYSTRYSTRIPILGIENSDSVNLNAWNAGFGAWFSVLLLVAAGGWVLVTTVGGRLRLPVSGALITLSLCVLAFVTIVLRWATFPDATSGLDERGDLNIIGAVTASSGAGAGLYLGLVATVTAVAASLLAFRAAGRIAD